MALLHISVHVPASDPVHFIADIDDRSGSNICDTLKGLHNLVMTGEITGSIADAIRQIDTAKPVSPNAMAQFAKEEEDATNSGPGRGASAGMGQQPVASGAVSGTQNSESEVVQPVPAPAGSEPVPGGAVSTTPSPPTPPAGEQVATKKGKTR